MGAQTMFRQIGATMGVSGFVAILGTPHGPGVLDAFNNTRVFMIAAVAIAVALLAIRANPQATTAGTAAAAAHID